MVVDYESELLRRGEAFRENLAKAVPKHPDLGFIDADIAARIALIGTLTTAQTERASKKDFRQETLYLLAGSTFRGFTTVDRVVLDILNYDIFLPTQAKTLHEVVAENSDYFRSYVLNFVDSKPELRDYVPPALTVALRSTELFLVDSFGKSQDAQLRIHEVENQAVQTRLPHARSIMLPASTIAQLDLAYFKETGQVLIEKGFVRALDEISRVRVALVGRDRPGDQLQIVLGQHRGSYDVGTLAAVVMIDLNR